MFTNAEPQQMDLAASQEDSHDADSQPRKEILVSKILYAFLPYFYLTIAFAAIFATLYISEWFWVLPHYLLCSAACVHVAIAVARRNSQNGVSAQK